MSAKLLLNSWKEIANFVGRSERTVQRWEKWYGLPVCRPAGKERSAVIALASEIEAWTMSARTGAEERPCPKPEVITTLLYIGCHSHRLAMQDPVMESSGYHLLAALDISSGLRLFENNRVDVVILEFPTHSLDTDSIARELHRSRPEVPILILSRRTKHIPQVILNLISGPAQERPQTGISPDASAAITQSLNSNATVEGFRQRTRKSRTERPADKHTSATLLHDVAA